jgi:hypothetical protein
MLVEGRNATYMVVLWRREPDQWRAVSGGEGEGFFPCVVVLYGTGVADAAI